MTNLNVSKIEMSVIDCPRCKKNKLYKIPALNSVSRRDNKTHICGECGTEEALIDYFGGNEDLSWLKEVPSEAQG